MKRSAASCAAMLTTAMLAFAGVAWAQAPRPAPGVMPQVTPAMPSQAPGTAPAQPAVTPQPLSIESGSGRLLQLPAPAVTVIAAEPRVARVQPTSPTSLFIMGVAPGRTSVVATAEDGTAIAEYDVTVRPGPLDRTASREPPPASAAAIESAIRRNLRGMEGVRVSTAGRNSLILSGTVATAADAQRAEAIVRAMAGENREVTNNLQLLSAIQVNVRVRVAEISREITRELGLNWRAFGQAGDFLIGLRTGPAALSVLDAVTSSRGSLVTSPSRFAIGGSGKNFDVNAVIDALAQDQLISILAEPNLTAQSGETASFLAGGEFPIPVAATLTGQISIEFKQFGVSLSFVPTVLSPDRLNLRIRPEVSELTDQGAVTVPLGNTGSVVTIPALSVRRAETTVELGSGQSFAIAGLLQRNIRQIDSGLNGLGEVPVLGALFRSDRFQRRETELVIIVTPYLVRPVSDPHQLVAATDGFRPAVDIDRVLYQRQIARGASMPQLHGRPDAGFILE